MESIQPWAVSVNVGSLFAGIGGFDLAAERVGMTVEWQSELDTKASAVLDYHWPTVKNLGDIYGIKSPPAVDVLTGGFPCQDYSVAGTRDGLAGDRGALWWEYLRLIAEFRPTWVVGENVPGLLSSRDGADFETIVGSLTECGYGVAWAVLDAQYFGVAQRRRRVFIVGHSGGEPRPEILALSEGVFGYPEKSRETGKRVAPTLAGRTRGGGWPETDEAVDGALAFAWQAGGNNSASGAYEYEHSPTLPVGQTMAVVQNQRDEIRDLGDKAGALAAEPGMKQQTYVLRTKNLHDDVRGDVWMSDLPGTLQASGAMPNQFDAVHNGAQVRRLTPLECERLQGFPDGWTDIPGNSDTQRYRQLGNAVAVPVVEWILGNIMAAV